MKILIITNFEPFKECKEAPKNKKELTMDRVMESLASKLGWNVDRVDSMIRQLNSFYPAAAFSILCREIALLLDRKYPDHISNCETVFFISNFDGRIHSTNKGYIKEYRNFAAFRTEEDARVACRLLRPYLKSMFSSEKTK